MADQWNYSRAFDALGYRFQIRSTDERITGFFDDVFESFVTADQPRTQYSIVAGESRGGSRSLYVDDRLVGTFERPSRLVGWVTWHINSQVIAEGTERYVLLHASAAASDGRCVLFPAAPEAGKTTLVAGLVRSGFAYVTDEAAAIDPKTLEIEPYPKPLSIDPGSWGLLDDLAPDDGEGYHAEQWHVSPTWIRPDAVSGPVPVSLLVFPKFVAGAPTRCVPITRSAGLVEMMSHTFRFHRHGRRNLEVLARTLRSVDCYELVNGDLREACDAIRLLFGGEGSSQEQPGVRA
jgi:hypothetical protein